MVTLVIGYPQEATFCPNCGSTNIETHDMGRESGLVICKECGCRCFVIEADENDK